MNRHQVLTGAVNSGDECYAVGSVEGVQFTAYAAGCDIVILASDFQRIQIIPGSTHGNVQIGCIDCSNDTGKIAASYGPTVFIFEPTPLVNKDSEHKLDYMWYRTGTIVTDEDVHTLAFNDNGSKMLTGGDLIQMWKAPIEEPSDDEPDAPGKSKFQLGGDPEDSAVIEWDCVWQCRTANPVCQMKFSPDGRLFSTIGKNDRVVKIWYENTNKELLHLSRSNSVMSPRKNQLGYTFVYVAHPRAVTGFSWRKTSPHMPKGCVANVLLTSCKDNICRIWCETVVPDDGLMDLQPFESSESGFNHVGPAYRSQIIQTIEHIRNAAGNNRRMSQLQPATQQKEPIPNQFNSLKNLHQVHKMVGAGGLKPTLHFHLAASINPETDIPLLPTIGYGSQENSTFVVHWMNNKELHFTSEAEKIIRQLEAKASEAQRREMRNNRENGGKEGSKANMNDEDGTWQNQPSLNEEDEDATVELSAEDVQEEAEEEDEEEAEKNENELDTSPLERLIERLLRDWYQNVDVVFMVHPVDGSFLVWLIEWLDESRPGSFRQAQVNFSSRIPQCFPVGDATTMSTNLKLFSNFNSDILLRQQTAASANSRNSSPIHQRQNQDIQSGLEVHMISNHSNGSLNLWRITFSENSKFSVVLNVSHASRACGHRFRTNQAACHPVLPLLITSSHHNLPKFDANFHLPRSPSMSAWCEAAGFCSELILWKVESVGPLSKSGGITEISRINSPHISAFSNVAWLPTLLPSSTLGSMSNSPSALFIASDGKSLRLYQAVIDARTILNEINRPKDVESYMKLHMRHMSMDSSMDAEELARPRPSGTEHLDIVSLQSTARPGCIIELDAIKDACQDWQHTQFLHVYQGQMITNKKSSLYAAMDNDQMEAVVDLRNITIFEEHFYLVVVEKREDGRSMLHMWRIVIASKPEGYDLDAAEFAAGEDEEMDHMNQRRRRRPTAEDSMKLSITTKKVSSQILTMPPHVEVISTAVAAGHLSSASIYPACYAPYLLSTVCSDSTVRFWKCHHTRSGQEETYDWREWRMMIPSDDCSSILLSGTPIAVSCAYSGRIAVAHRSGRIRTSQEHPEKKYVNLVVSIYECESTGGSEWTLEDTINLKDITIPDPRAEIDLNLINNPCARMDLSPTKSPSRSISRSQSIPSLSTIYTIRRLISEGGNEGGRLTQKLLIQLDWVSTEDGTHVLTIGVGSKVLMFAPVSTEIALASKQDIDSKEKLSHRPRPVLQKTKSMTVPDMVDEIRWMRLRSIELCSADGLPALPMHVSWCRDGILVVGMDNEMHVYTQWRGSDQESEEINETTFSGLENQRILADINRVASGSNLTLKPNSSLLKISHSSSSLKKMGELKGGKTFGAEVSTESVTSLQFIQDCGLFEAARMANPVLPQYHPRQLLELLNFGKIRRVKAILAHLTRCITGSQRSKDTAQSKTRRMSLSAPTAEANTLQEEVLDYVEINSIPPLPLYALLAADHESAAPAQDTGATSPYGTVSGAGTTNPQNDNDYSALFATEEPSSEWVDDDDVFGGGGTESGGSDSGMSQKGSRKRRTSSSSQATNPNYFGPGQCRMLASHLTYTHLPGLSRLDQMYLLALADTVANTSVDFSDRFAPDRAVKSLVQSREQHQQTATGTFGEGTGGYAEPGAASMGTADSFDDCGLRYMLAMRHYIYLKRTLPMRQRAKIQSMGLGSAYFVWAFHSEAEEELLSFVPSMRKGDLTWNELRQFGCGWWIRNNHVLRRTFEKIAKAAFQARKDPMDAALFYLAMKKKNLLRGLFRSVSDSKMSDFLSNDFSQDRWRRAALKNAFALLGKQRFEHATGFFLLAGALRDAIDVCLRKLEDIQLAMVIARLYESELDESVPPNLIRIFNEEILGIEPDGDTDYSKQSPDPFCRSMAYWMLKEYGKSLQTLLDFEAGGSYSNSYAIDSYSAGPSVFNFYTYLRTHPLLVRRDIAAAAQNKGKPVMIAGFTHGKSTSLDHNVMITDKITPVERRLYFTTSHAHLKAGCPHLALEVLSKLPEMIDPDAVKRDDDDEDNVDGEALVQRQKPPKITIEPRKQGSIDWGQSAIEMELASKPHIDWSKPVGATPDDEEFQIKFSDSEDEDEPMPDIFEVRKAQETACRKAKKDSEPVIDIMAQQVKFIACLKLMMEELGTLATGFEVDGGQLRYQLYVYLEREVECLKKICNYGGSDSGSVSSESDISVTAPGQSQSTPGQSPSVSLTYKRQLHEQIRAEQMDLQAKLERMAKRKQWLRCNQTLLRTLLSYCCLQGSSGGGLSSVRMELILLLQELQQEKTQQLSSPLPFPTTLPLLSASVASSKTVIADPIQHLQNLSRDILKTVVDFDCPPSWEGQDNLVYTLRNLSAALSACIYQSLCDSDSVVVTSFHGTDIGMEGFTNTCVVYQDSYLMAGGRRQRRVSSTKPDVTTTPAQWPGVSALTTMLRRERDEEAPKLHILLAESLIGIYVSLLIHALSTYDASILYRLVAHPFSEVMWTIVFGGGARSASVDDAKKGGIPRIKDESSKKRVNLNMKLFGHEAVQAQKREGSTTFTEEFIPPELSILSYFMSKPLPSDGVQDDYDSEEEMSSDEEDEDEMTEGAHEHLDAKSYSWAIMRLAVIKLVHCNIETFLPLVGIELSELPVSSPLIHAALRSLQSWIEMSVQNLETYPPPSDNYIPGCAVDMFTHTGPPINKYKSMLDPTNTPFQTSHHTALPAKRLWRYLCRQEFLQDIFIRYIFKRRKMIPHKGSNHSLKTAFLHSREPVKIIHREQDIITAFCVNQANLNCISLSTTKEVMEMDITDVLEPPSWLDDETEYDIVGLRDPLPLRSDSDDFLVVNVPQDRHYDHSPDTPSAPGVVPAPMNLPQQQTGRGAHVITKRTLTGVRRMGAHPQLPYYLTGAQDGSVKLWEWGHQQCISVPRQPGTHSKVSKILFNQLGNKFGVSDSEGSVSLWQVGLGVSMSKPYMNMKCHNKAVYDFAFAGSSSVFASAGFSTDNKNVCLWDTLLPQRSCCVQAFTCHDQGCPTLIHVPQHQLIISGGRKGEICIFDLRQRQLRHTFSGHDSAVKCLALDPAEEFFVSGSSEGDLKIWGLTQHKLLASFAGEHSKNTLFRNIGSSVMDVALIPENHLFSCGSDGSLKVRTLTSRNTLVSTYG